MPRPAIQACHGPNFGINLDEACGFENRHAHCAIVSSGEAMMFAEAAAAPKAGYARD